MRGLAQVDRLADNHIVARLDLLDDASLLARFLLKLHVVAHGNRVGASNAVQADFAPQAAFPLATRLIEDDVPAARRFDDLA